MNNYALAATGALLTRSDVDAVRQYQKKKVKARWLHRYNKSHRGQFRAIEYGCLNCVDFPNVTYSWPVFILAKRC